MGRSSFIFGSSLVFVLLSRAIAVEPGERSTTIPLDQIWGYNLQGTKDIAGIPLPDAKPSTGQSVDTFRRQREHNIEQFRRALTVKPSTERAMTGFVLPWKADFYALGKASGVVANAMRPGQQPQEIRKDAFPVGDEATLVFFSHPTSYYVRLRKVERNDHEITVQYEFEPHASPEVTVHFAMIPLGKLPVGEYQVRFEQIPLAQKFRDAGFQPVEPQALKIVSRGFSFTVFERPVEEKTPDNATVIPLDQIWAYEMPGTRDVRTLDAIKRSTGVTESPITSQIVSSLSSQKLPEGQKTPAAFVVVGTNENALRNAHAVFMQDAERAHSLPAAFDLSLVFFSYISGRYVNVVSVEQVENTYVIKYRLVSHNTAESTAHFAIIPLGKLREGAFEVKVKQLPPIHSAGGTARPLPDPERIVCQGFSFRVNKE